MYFSRTFLIAFFLFVFVSLSSLAGPTARTSLYENFSEWENVKTYVHPVTIFEDEDIFYEKDVFNEKYLRDELSNSLRTRMTINFEIVDSVSDADITIAWEIVEFISPPDRSLDPERGFLRRFLDLIMFRNQARMESIFTVKQQQGGHILFRRRLSATLNRSEIKEEKVFDKLAERTVKIFFREAFSKRDDTSVI